jgi:dCTP deaminase
MSLISYLELLDLVEQDVIEGVDFEDVNGSSIDVHLGPTILVERYSEGRQIVSLQAKEQMGVLSHVMPAGGYYDLRPGEFILAHTVEKFNMPAGISAEFKLNSSGARIGLENALATWCDPHWHGSVLTLELKNFSQFHTIRLHNGCRIGQMIFHRSADVPVDRGYSVRGRYNGDTSVSGVKV